MNYEPALFINRLIKPWFDLSAGIVHQSNGRGEPLERSWNRVYVEGVFSKGNWMLNAQPWYPIFKAESSDRHNPDIINYMGYGRVLVAYKYGNNVFSLMGRNYLESGFRRGATEFTWSYQVNRHIKTYAIFFSGYGQSLIEYNHYTNAVGLGIALSDWL
jgi:phospholipase A1